MYDIDAEKFQEWAQAQVESLQRSVETGRLRLARAAERETWGELDSLVQHVAADEFALDVAVIVADGAGRLVAPDTDVTVDDLVQYLTTQAVRQVDDGWSGRGNDTRRAAHEGRQTQLGKTFDWLRFHC